MLFVCVHNAGRSQMAAGWLARIAGDRVDIRSAGSEPTITMGCGDIWTIYPGKRYEDWQLTDPARQPIEIVRAIRDDIEHRIRALAADLLGAEAR